MLKQYDKSDLSGLNILYETILGYILYAVASTFSWSEMYITISA